MLHIIANKFPSDLGVGWGRGKENAMNSISNMVKTSYLVPWRHFRVASKLKKEKKREKINKGLKINHDRNWNPREQACHHFSSATRAPCSHLHLTGINRVNPGQGGDVGVAWVQLNFIKNRARIWAILLVSQESVSWTFSINTRRLYWNSVVLLDSLNFEAILKGSSDKLLRPCQAMRHFLLDDHYPYFRDHSHYREE